MRRKNRCCGRI